MPLLNVNPLLPRTDFVHYALLCRATGIRPTIARYERWLPAQIARRRHSERELERQIWIEPVPMVERLRRLVEALESCPLRRPE